MIKGTTQKNIEKIIKQQNKKKLFFFLYSIKMSKKALKFGDAEVNNKTFHASKQLIALDFLINLYHILIVC